MCISQLAEDLSNSSFCVASPAYAPDIINTFLVWEKNQEIINATCFYDLLVTGLYLNYGTELIPIMEKSESLKIQNK